MNDQTDQYPQELHGFFVGIPNGCTFKGPYELLSNARYEVNLLNSKHQIFHGILKYISEGVIDDSKLFLVPDTRKQE
jgi:hypothetical protein